MFDDDKSHLLPQHWFEKDGSIFKIYYSDKNE